MKMNRNTKSCLWTGISLLTAFLLWTLLITRSDLQAVGPNGTEVGLATFNLWFHSLTGVHLILYTITDWLGLVPIVVCLCFAALGAVQLVKRRSLLRVDRDIILLGLYYILVIFCYLFFEMVPINYRPILINGVLEASYPAGSECDHRVCDRIFDVHGDWATDSRRPLGDGYYRGCSAELRALPALSIFCPPG